MIFQSMCASFKKELLEGIHDFTSDVFKVALYEEGADLDEETTAYTTSGEISGTGYSAGGEILTAVAPSIVGLTAIADFEDLTFSTLTVSNVRGALIYNSSKSNRAVAVLDFGRVLSKTAEDLTLTFPAPDARNSVVRIK